MSIFMSFAFKQKDNVNLYPEKINHQRLNTVIITGSVLYAGSMTVLYKTWYSKYPRSRFHFFNDNAEWQQMDKFGHATTSYYLGSMGYEALRWAGVNKNKATWYGGSVGLLFLTNVEIFDGFSSEWGFSPGDMTANILGSGLFIGQQLGWNEQRFIMKWGFHSTLYSNYRPDMLGSGFFERCLKDYNGQTYWLSFSPYSVHSAQCTVLSKINIAVGYGAEGMLGGRENPTKYKEQTLPTYKRYRKFFISPDLDLARLNTKSEFGNLGLDAFNFLKTPLPALEFNTNNKLKFHLLYF